MKTPGCGGEILVDPTATMRFGTHIGEHLRCRGSGGGQGVDQAPSGLLQQRYDSVELFIDRDGVVLSKPQNAFWGGSVGLDGPNRSDVVNIDEDLAFRIVPLNKQANEHGLAPPLLSAQFADERLRLCHMPVTSG
jgi:hypothetical protein